MLFMQGCQGVDSKLFRRAVFVGSALIFLIRAASAAVWDTIPWPLLLPSGGTRDKLFAIGEEGVPEETPKPHLLKRLV
jgi:hypothetical protein